VKNKELVAATALSAGRAHSGKKRGIWFLKNQDTCRKSMKEHLKDSHSFGKEL
jgi:hypothetical protein